MRLGVWFVISLVGFAVAACSGQQKAAAPPETAGEAPPARESSGAAERGERARAPQPAICPFAEPDVKGKVEDIEGGAALTFTGGPERVGPLRTAAGEMAAMYEQVQGMRAMAPEDAPEQRRGGRGMGGRGMDGRGMGGRGMHMGGVAMPPAELSVSEIGSGVQIALTARSREDVPEVRAQAFRMYQHMRAGMCAPGIGLCPFGLPNVNAEAADVEGGAALTFTGDPESLPLLRAAADNLVSVHSTRARKREGDTGMMAGRGPMVGMRGMVPAEVRAEDVEGGVRIVVSARRSEDVPRLREQVFRHVARMREGRCRVSSLQ